MGLCRGRVYAALGIQGDKIPKDMEGVYTIPLYTEPAWFMGPVLPWAIAVQVTVIKQRGRSKHRIFVPCCGRLIPFGRLFQHAKGHKR